MPYGGYEEYIRSEIWKRKSEAARAYFKSCGICNTKVDLVVHHKHYETLGREGLDDITVLCKRHHWEWEEQQKKKKERRPVLMNREVMLAVTADMNK